MKKSPTLEKDTSFALDTRTITPAGLNLNLTATPQQCQYYAKYFDIHAIKNLALKLHIFAKEDVFFVKGTLNATLNQECVVSLSPFENTINADIYLCFSQNQALVEAQNLKIDFDINDEPIDLIPKGIIYFKDVIAEQLGLNIDPFPKNTEEAFEYYEQKSENTKINPFAVLNQLTKK